MTNKINFQIHNSCKLVKAYNTYVIYDLLKSKFHLIPNEIGKYFSNNSNRKKLSIEGELALKQLLKEDIVFVNNKKVYSNLMKFTSDFEIPCTISNLIIDYSNFLTKKENGLIILDIVENLLIKNMQITLNSSFDINRITEFLNLFSTSILQHIEIIILDYCVRYSDLNLLIKNDRVNSAIFIREQKNLIKKKGKIIFLNKKIYLTGTHPIKFSIDKNLFDESQQFNTYFNKKLYISKNGNVSNAPECQETFINIFKTKPFPFLYKMIESKKFQKYWKIRKDICNVCKDCEYRYMCVDNRLPYLAENGFWSHNEECNYNPYTQEWKLKV